MVEETLVRRLEVPTQEWLRSHTVWFEEEQEERKYDRRERIIIGALSVITFVFIIALMATWGGY